jgi:hypothetical protein
MPWQSPFKLKLVACKNIKDWKKLKPAEEALLPLPPHPGAFGDVRLRHIHEGVDLYTLPDTPIYAIEDGLIVGVTPLSGGATRNAYWHDMEAVLVQGKSGLLVYGELAPLKGLAPAQKVKAGELLGHIYPKGYHYKNTNRKDEDEDHRFFHLELHHPEIRLPTKWLVDQPKPETLHDPTPFLMEIARKL